MYYIDDVEFKESELIRVMADSEANTVFNFGSFSLLFLYHVMHAFLSPFISVPLIWLLERCNCKIVYNIKLIGSCLDPLVFFPFITSVFTSTCTALIIYGWLHNQVEILDYIDFWCIMLGRQVVVCVKYAFYSKNHFKIIRGVYMSSDLVKHLLILPAQFM